MYQSQLQYLPLTPPFFLILVGLFVVLLVLLQLGALNYAFMRLGLRPGAALLLLFACLVGSYFNILLAVNVGGAVIPTCMSIYLLARHQLWVPALIATAVVAAVCYWLSHPVPGLGIAEPVFVPALTTSIVALILSREHAAALAYIGGSLGTLIGADLLNLGAIRGLGAPVASIGGAGTFDGIFLIGIVAVLLASLWQPWRKPQ